MAWVKLTDDFTEHRKVLSAGPLAGWLWVSAIAWTNRNKRNGVVPRQVIPRLACFDGIGVYTSNFTGDDVDVWRLADELVAVGLLEEHPEGFYVHDYEDYQLTTDEIARRRALKSAAGKKGADSRWHGTSHSSSDGSEMARHPSPGPVTDSSVVSPSDDDVPDAAWQRFAALRFEQQPAGTVKNPLRWKQKVIRNGKEELGHLATDWWRMFDVTPLELGDALAEGEVPRSWNNRRRRSA